MAGTERAGAGQYCHGSDGTADRRPLPQPHGRGSDVTVVALMNSLTLRDLASEPRPSGK